MSDIEKRLADICEGYFQDLERQACRPEGCSGDDLAKRLVAELGLTEEWSNYVAGPDWARHRRYVTPSEMFPGPKWGAS